MTRSNNNLLAQIVIAAMRVDVDQAVESERNDCCLAQLSVVISAEENQTMKFKFATLALTTALALSSTFASARNYHYHHQSYDRSNVYRSYNSMDMMSAEPTIGPRFGGPAYFPYPIGGSSSATSNGGPGGGGGGGGP